MQNPSMLGLKILHLLVLGFLTWSAYFHARVTQDLNLSSTLEQIVTMFWAEFLHQCDELK